MVRDIDHELALHAKSIDLDRVWPNRAAHEELDRLAWSYTARAGISGQRRVLDRAEWFVQIEITATRGRSR